jgi:hypothetical protein
MFRLRYGDQGGFTPVFGERNRDLADNGPIAVMIRAPFVLNLVVLVLSLTAFPTGTTGELQAQASPTTGHEHLGEVACVDVHTHPGPEGWYVLAGEQCLDTPAGANKAVAGQTMTVEPNVPMELNVTGTTLRRAFALVIHDSTQDRGIPSDWKPSGKCGS